MENSRNNQPLVSVLMPVYKTPEDILKKTIQSVLNQTYKNFEFLILDDCPEHPVENIVKQYQDSRIKYLKNEKNLGITPSRNKLLKIAKGEYLAVADHDDISLPERFEKEVSFLNAHPDVGVVGTWYQCFPKKKLKKKFITNAQIERDLMRNCSILHPSSMIRKSVLEQNHITYQEQYSPAEDYALWISLIGKTKFANIPEVLYLYRDYANNTSKTQAMKMKSARDRLYRLLEEKYPEHVAKATTVKVIKLFGLPLIKREQKGCVLKYTILHFIKITTQEAIDFN